MLFQCRVTDPGRRVFPPLMPPAHPGSPPLPPGHWAGDLPASSATPPPPVGLISSCVICVRRFFISSLLGNVNILGFRGESVLTLFLPLGCLNDSPEDVTSYWVRGLGWFNPLDSVLQLVVSLSRQFFTEIDETFRKVVSFVPFFRVIS